MVKLLACAVVVAVWGVSVRVHAQSAEDLACNNAAQDLLQTCQKRVTPVAAPVDPKNPTAAEQKAMDKHAKAWQACKEKAQRRAVDCRR